MNSLTRIRISSRLINSLIMQNYYLMRRLKLQGNGNVHYVVKKGNNIGLEFVPPFQYNILKLVVIMHH